MTFVELFDLTPKQNAVPEINGPPATYLMGADGMKRIDFMREVRREYGLNFQTHPKAKQAIADFDLKVKPKDEDEKVQTLSELFGGR